MPDNNLVANHYTQGSLLEAFREGIKRLGKTVDNVTVQDLGPADEFHIGGRVATESLLDQLDIVSGHHVLDVGCGIGGSSRFAAQKYGCRVTGVDLTREYVETGNALCSWVGLSDQVSLEVDNATNLSNSSGTFDRAYMLHVGMNIADKEALASELHRVIKPGGKIGIYDIMKVDDGDLLLPLPWATEPEGSSVAPLATYKSALEKAGFHIVAERNRREFALEFFDQLQSKATNAEGPPPLGLHMLMGDTAPIKISNMLANVSRNVVAPIELIGEKIS